MEEVIKMVVSIDQKASDIMKQTQEYIETREKDVRDRIEAMRTEIMERTKNDVKSLYESTVKEAEEEAKKIRCRADEDCEIIENKFQKIKEKLESQLFSRIFG